MVLELILGGPGFIRKLERLVFLYVLYKSWKRLQRRGLRDSLRDLLGVILGELRKAPGIGNIVEGEVRVCTREKGRCTEALVACLDSAEGHACVWGGGGSGGVVLCACVCGRGEQPCLAHTYPK